MFVNNPKVLKFDLCVFGAFLVGVNVEERNWKFMQA